ncbi:MAG: Alpha-1,4-N-acetylgalactosamine transferase PglJ [Rhodanobacteraceae bacterium]|jgi:glycosyltransferase involved in cell wall biosynthesis|nr:MAG: Alpha-1,4-N-acetylgalactosamine transferase PglJ [Rhodanobacteraceae bacterium]
MKLVLVISSLGGGGAERVMTLLANEWVERGDEVTLITLASDRMDRYPLNPSVRRIALDVAGNSANLLAAIGNNLVRIRALRRAIAASRPDAVISFIAESNVRVLIAAAGLRVPVIISERTALNGHHMRGVWRTLRRWSYPRATAIVAQTRRSAADLEALVRRRVEVIANPVTVESRPDDAIADERTGARTLLAVGRLSPEKGFDLLIEAFAQAAPRHPGWNLVILGEGPLRAALERKAAEHGLGARISMPGFDAHVRRLMRRADLFVLSSRYEGFPNALLEAMTEGLACVSFDCDAGPRELIEHRQNGWLVPAGDVPALAAALDTLMGDAGLRAQLGRRARDVSARYSPATILDQWNALVASVLPAPAAGAMPR